MSGSQTFGDLDPSEYPGQRLGMPERGPGSIARVGRRSVALVVDYAAAVLLASLGYAYLTPAHSAATLVIFFALQTLFIPTMGASFGHRMLGLRIVALDGTWVGFARAGLRSALLVVVIPALVWDSDQRGFHDKVAGTALIRAA